MVAAAASLDVTLTESELAVKESSPDGRTVVFHPAGPFTDDIKARIAILPSGRGTGDPGLVNGLVAGFAGLLHIG